MDESGLVAVGADLSTSRLLDAYKKGIFPWYDADSPILWWCPEPRCVLFPDNLKVSKSMQQVIKGKLFSFTINKAFNEVIAQCSMTKRKEQDGTWINNEMIKAYNEMHALGHAHSAEAWVDGKLVGGLYGIKMGQVFFGESMFSHQSNASKFAFIKYVHLLQSEGIKLIDCQVETNHLISLGATLIGRADFINMLAQLT